MLDFAERNMQTKVSRRLFPIEYSRRGLLPTAPAAGKPSNSCTVTRGFISLRRVSPSVRANWPAKTNIRNARLKAIHGAEVSPHD